jgi:hypothetical protein
MRRGMDARLLMPNIGCGRTGAISLTRQAWRSHQHRRDRKANLDLVRSHMQLDYVAEANNVAPEVDSRVSRTSHFCRDLYTPFRDPRQIKSITSGPGSVGLTLLMESSSHKHRFSANTGHAVGELDLVICRRQIIGRPPSGSDILCLYKKGDEVVSLVVTGGEQVA